MYYVTLAAHPSCIYSPEEMLQKVNSNWQCERCKTCTVCCETSDAVSFQYIFSYFIQCFIQPIFILLFFFFTLGASSDLF